MWRRAFLALTLDLPYRTSERNSSIRRQACEGLELVIFSWHPVLVASRLSLWRCRFAKTGKALLPDVCEAVDLTFLVVLPRRTLSFQPTILSIRGSFSRSFDPTAAETSINHGDPQILEQSHISEESGLSPDPRNSSHKQ